MLQQTQAVRVEPIFVRFCERWPTPAALAAAPTSDVVRAWQGLGYNRRAVALQRAATVIVERHEGEVPQDLDDLLALPGVGPYTARAVLAFGFGADAAPVDTNVARVLARAVSPSPLTPVAAQRLADALVPTGAAAAWSSALMDLGAGPCRARSPRCGDCPWASRCSWRRRGGPDPALPVAPGSRPPSFVQTDRYRRGRLVDALRAGPVAAGDLTVAAGCGDDHERALRLANALVADGLAAWSAGRLRLP